MTDRELLDRPEDGMKILHLTLKKQWFDMIASGVKKEEYRELKPYWHKRLANKQYDAISFRNGCSKGARQILVELKEVCLSFGIVEWGAPEETPVYILRLGKIVSQQTLHNLNHTNKDSEQ